MNKPIVIFGTGDIAQLAKYYFDVDSNYKVAAFTVDKDYKKDDSFEGLPVIEFGELAEKFPPEKYAMFVALSYSKMNAIREKKYFEAKSKGYELVSYVSSKCSYISQYGHGDNCFILEDNTIQPFVRIGNNVTLWSGNHIGHHSEIADHNFVSSHVVISGHCYVGSNCFLGVNATVHNNVRIESHSLVSAGAIISKNTEPSAVVVPAKSSVLPKKSHEINF